MKKRFFIFLFFIAINVCSQNAQDIIEGLKKELKTNLDLKKRAVLYSDIGWYYSNVSIDSALVYGKKALFESEKLNDSTLIAQVYSDLGAIYFRKGNYDLSKNNYLKAYKIRKLKKDYPGIAKININLASIFIKNNEHLKGLKSYLEAEKYFESIGNKAIVGEIKSNVGFAFFELKNYKKSLQYSNEAIPYLRENKLNDKLCNVYLTIGNNYSILKDTINAVKNYKIGLKIAEEAGNKVSMSSFYNNLSNLKLTQGKNKEAQELLNKSKIQRDLLNSNIQNVELELTNALNCIKNSKYEEAKLRLIKIEPLFLKINAKENLLLTYNLFVTVYGYLNNPEKTNLYFEKYKTLNNEMFNKNVINKTTELETKYQTAKKEKIIVEQNAKVEKQTTYLVIVSFSILALLIFGFLVYKQQKLKNIQQAQTFELKSAIAKIETQNQLHDQKLAISRDLHDNIGAQLTFIISSVDNIKHGFEITNDKISNKLTNISSFAKETIVELRDTIWAMNHSQITFDDLQNRINNFIEKAQNATEAIEFVFEIENSIKEKYFTSVEGMNIYRIIQEAINNAVKYSNCTQINIKAITTIDKIVISIDDNGKGFDSQLVEKGNGLNNMKKRIEEINGTFKIISNQLKGTQIILELKNT